VSLTYTPIVEVVDVGLLAMPFRLADVGVIGLHDRVWVSRDSLARGRNLNRYTGDVEFLTDPPGFGEGGFGEGIFGWS
jgi:hypothetical protein